MEKAAFVIYIIVLLFSPLAFGATPVYAHSIMVLGILTASLFLMRSNLKKDFKRGRFLFQYPLTSLNLLFFGFLILLFVQIIPLPPPLLRMISPEAAVIGPKSLPLSIFFSLGNSSGEWFSLAPYDLPVRLSNVRWTVYGLFCLGLIQTLNSRKRIELTVFLILTVGCFEALYGLAQTYSGSGSVWWYRNPGSLMGATGTYIGHAHFAGLMEMVLLLATSFSAGMSGERRRLRDIPGLGANIRVRLSRFFSREQRYNKRTLILFGGVTAGIGLIFSASRGGMLAGAGGLLCLGLLYLFRRDHRRKGAIVLLLFLITAIYALHIGVEKPLARFKSFHASMEVRERFALRTMDLFRDYPLTGVGLGNFQYAYPKYQSAEDGKYYVDFAHNDWAQFLAEAGIAGFGLLAAGISFYLFRTLAFWRRRRDPFAVCLGVMPLAAMTAMGIHAYVDFNLHIPANFLMLSALVAIGYSAMHLERHHGREKSLIRYGSMPLRYGGLLLMSLILALVLWSASLTIRHFMAESYCATSPHGSLKRDKNPPVEEIQAAISWNGGNARYWWKLAWELIRIRDDQYGKLKDEIGLGPTDDSRPIQKRIIRAIEGALRLNPFKAEYHLQAGWEYARLRQEPDYHQKWLPAADRSMERAAFFAGEYHPSTHEGLGNYWVMRSKSLRPFGPEWHEVWARARWHYRKALSLAPRPKPLEKRIRESIWSHYPDELFVGRLLG